MIYEITRISGMLSPIVVEEVTSIQLQTFGSVGNRTHDTCNLQIYATKTWNWFDTGVTYGQEIYLLYECSIYWLFYMEKMLATYRQMHSNFINIDKEYPN